jgi:hypothetical protein
MSRIRFLTAIAVCSQALSEPADWLSPAGVPAFLAFEWHVLEAMVRVAPTTQMDAVPGIQKARSRLRNRKRHLDARSYLQTPKVFGFHGVYKRLAKDFGLVDEALVLLDRGRELVATWEREQHLRGFSQGRGASAGARFAGRVVSAVSRALDAGSVQVGPSSGLWKTLSDTLAPGSATKRERRLLWNWLTEEVHPVRRELAGLVAASATDLSERGTVEELLGRRISPELRARLHAVEAFEALVRPLDDGFQLLRSVMTQHLPHPVALTAVAERPRFSEITRQLPAAFGRAVDAMAALDLASELELTLGELGEPMQPAELVEAILKRHDDVQVAKGKRAWFERDERGVLVRGIGRLDEPFQARVEFLHPYRIYALRSFARDLQPSGLG